MQVNRLHALAVALATTIAIAPRAASADAIDACIDAADAGQKARDERDLKRAREFFLRCSAAHCPTTVRNDCVRWLDEVQQGFPTVVFYADAGPGRDITNVRVYVDDQLVAQQLDGRSVFVEPGQRRVRFVWNEKTVDLQVLVVEGEKNRKVAASFKDTTTTTPVTTSEPSAVSRPLGPWPWVATAIGVAGLASFTGFGLSGRAAVSDLESCSPRCNPKDVDSAQTKYLVADISLVVGLVGLGVAAFLFITHDPGAKRVARP